MTVINSSYIANSDRISRHRVGSDSYLKYESEGWCMNMVDVYRMFTNYLTEILYIGQMVDNKYASQ